MPHGETTRITYLVIADEGHKDIVVGAFSSLESAQDAVAHYRDSNQDPFCWIEQSLRDVVMHAVG